MVQKNNRMVLKKKDKPLIQCDLHNNKIKWKSSNV